MPGIKRLNDYVLKYSNKVPVDCNANLHLQSCRLFYASDRVGSQSLMTMHPPPFITLFKTKSIDF